MDNLLNILKSDINVDKFILVSFINLSCQEKEMVRSWRNSESIRKWMYNDHEITKEEHDSFFERLKDEIKNFYWVVKDESHEYLGVLSLNRMDLKNKNAYFGLYSNPDSKIPGVGRILVECVIKVAFDIIKLHMLKLEVIEDNVKVINLYKKMAFFQEGVLGEFVRKDGIWKNVIVMGQINKKEY